MTLLGLLIATVGGWIAINWLGGGLPTLFAAIALAFVVFAAIQVGAIKAGSWQR